MTYKAKEEKVDKTEQIADIHFVISKKLEQKKTNVKTHLNSNCFIITPPTFW